MRSPGGEKRAGNAADQIRDKQKPPPRPVVGDRYGTVFTFHNGADSCYGVRGFRCALELA